MDDTIRSEAAGRWPQIIEALTGIDVTTKLNRDGPCPFCGGKDRFRFDDKDGKGTWYCHHCGGDGSGGAGDGFSFLMRSKNWTFPQALEAVKNFLNAPTTHLASRTSQAPRWTPICPQPDKLIDLVSSGTVNLYNPRSGRWINGVPQHVAILRKKDGTLFGSVVRFKFGEKKMPFASMLCTNEAGEERLCISALPRPRPWYGEDEIKDDLPILVVQGERKRDLAYKLIGDRYNVVSEIGGDGAISLMDLSALENQEVIIWPDNDASGKKCADKLSALLKDKAKLIHIVHIPDELPIKGDVGDAIESKGWDAEKIISVLKAASVMTREPAQEPETIGFPDTTKKGKILDTIENVQALLTANNIMLQKDEITGKIYQRGLKYFDEKNPDANTVYSEIKSIAARAGIPTQSISDYVGTLLKKNTVNPLKKWIEGKKWDGVDRLETLYETLVTPEKFKSERKHLFIKRWLCSAINILYSDDGQTHGVLVLQGKEGIGKTTWFRNLLPKKMKEYFKESVSVDPNVTDSVRRALISWICELGELESTLRRDMGALKAFLTSSDDLYRIPYERSAVRKKRRTIFCASVNRQDFLKDDETNRRFWVIPCIQINDYSQALDVQQLWAQVKFLVDSGERTYLTPPEQIDLRKENENYREPAPISERMDTELDWEAPRRDWEFNTATALLKMIGPSDHLTRSDLLEVNAYMDRRNEQRKKVHGVRGYDFPPLKKYEQKVTAFTSDEEEEIPDYL